jgi:hypothetical protein
MQKAGCPAFALPELGRSWRIRSVYAKASYSIPLGLSRNFQVDFRNLAHENGQKMLQCTMILRTAVCAVACLCFVGLFVGQAAAGTAKSASHTDILTGMEVWHGPCAYDRNSADYQPGVDVYGNRVEPADTGTVSISIPNDTVLARAHAPGKHAPPIAAPVTVAGLSAEMNPKPDCGGKKPAAPSH